VNFRRLKKEKQAKQEAEAPSDPNGGGNKLETESNIVDGLIMLPDYPTTRQEALAFSQYGQTIQCLFDVYQIKETLDGSQPPDISQG
jgi:hypothetical protein